MVRVLQDDGTSTGMTLRVLRPGYECCKMTIRAMEWPYERWDHGSSAARWRYEHWNDPTSVETMVRVLQDDGMSTGMTLRALGPWYECCKMTVEAVMSHDGGDNDRNGVRGRYKDDGTSPAWNDGETSGKRQLNLTLQEISGDAEAGGNITGRKECPTPPGWHCFHRLCQWTQIFVLVEKPSLPGLIHGSRHLEAELHLVTLCAGHAAVTHVEDAALGFQEQRDQYQQCVISHFPDTLCHLVL